MSLLLEREGEVGITAKEQGSKYAQHPSGGSRASLSIYKDNNGGDQVEDSCDKGSEKVSPWPVDE